MNVINGLHQLTALPSDDIQHLECLYLGLDCASVPSEDYLPEAVLLARGWHQSLPSWTAHLVSSEI